MSIVIVGGNDRMSTRYIDICKEYKYKAKVFVKMPAEFNKKIGEPDLVVVFTNTCSHKMLNLVKQKASKSGIAVEMVHTASVSSLKSVLAKYS